MKKATGFFLATLVAVLTWICMVLSLGIVAVMVWPGEEEISGWFAIVILIVPIIVSILSWRSFYTKYKEKHFKPGSKSDFTPFKKTGNGVSIEKDAKLPKTAKKQTQLAENLLAKIETCVSLSNSTTSVYLFTEWYDEILEHTEILMRLNKVKFKSLPSLDHHRLKDEFQWHLCDAIVREKDEAIKDIKEKYRNSKEFQVKTVEKFERDISWVESRFSKDTAELASKSLSELKRLVGISESNVDSPPQHGGDWDLLKIDAMEGHDFEYWCAEALRNSGYTDVEVTKGSGDQGVDILATKEGIKFAFQCKRYNSPLGNTPVQEVFAGKSFYGCHACGVITNQYFTPGAKELADKTGVILWDRDWITEYLRQKYANSI